MSRSRPCTRISRTLIMVLLLLSALAHAEQSSDVRKYVTAAASLFEHLEYENALAALHRAKARSSGPDDDALIALYEGMILAERGDPAATNAFVLSLGINPDGVLPLPVSPKVQSMFDGIKAHVRRLLPRDAPPAEPAQTPPPLPAALPDNALAPPSVVEPAPSHKSSPGVRRWSWIPAGVGAGAIIAAVALTIDAGSAHDSLVSGAPENFDAAQRLATHGKTSQTISWALFAGGGASLVAALGMVIWGAPSSTHVKISARLGPGLVGGQLTVVWP